MKINGVTVINLQISNDLYSCDIVYDGHFLGHFKQSASYSDYFSFDRTVLENSKEAFKKSELYRISCFKTEADINDFYTISMFINDLCDLTLDEDILKKEMSKDGFYKLVIGESLITDETAYVSISDENQYRDAEMLLKKHFNNSLLIRSYQSMEEFNFDLRK